MIGQLPATDYTNRVKRAPFSLAPGLGKRGTTGFLRWDMANPRPFAARLAWRSGRSADEPLFRRIGLSPDANGRAQPAAPTAAVRGYRRGRWRPRARLHRAGRA